MKKILIGIFLSLICFIIALVIFNDLSFPFLGIGIVILGISIFIHINKNQN